MYQSYFKGECQPHFKIQYRMPRGRLALLWLVPLGRFGVMILQIWGQERSVAREVWCDDANIMVLMNMLLLLHLLFTAIVLPAVFTIQIHTSKYVWPLGVSFISQPCGRPGGCWVYIEFD
jgi:hypothetical protein